jgi:glycine N-methyltransferase
MTDIKTSVLYVSGKPTIVTMDYMIALDEENQSYHESISEFRLSYYPHRLTVFRDMLTEVFGHGAKHIIYGDFKPLNQIKNPAFYIHVMEKQF